MKGSAKLIAPNYSTFLEYCRKHGYIPRQEVEFIRDHQRAIGVSGRVCMLVGDEYGPWKLTPDAYGAFLSVQIFAKGLATIIPLNMTEAIPMEAPT